MCGHSTKLLGALALLAGFFGSLASYPEAEEAHRHTSSVRIGMIASLFSDVPASTVITMMQPFSAIMEAQTGVGGELVACSDAENLGQQLAEDKVQLGVFHGIEFAWRGRSIPSCALW